MFVRDDGQPLDFIPGQFIQVHFQYADGTATKRSYSLATIHDHALGPGEAVEIAVSYVPGGAATALFEGLDDGGTVDASGPFGRFCLMPADANRRYLLIGTGTGVTPYRAMLPQLETPMRRARRGGGAAVRRAHARPSCCTATSSAPSRTRTRNFRFVPCFSRELPARIAACPDVRHGYVQQVLAEFAPDAGARHRLPVRQPEHGRCLLRGAEGLGLPVPQIRREKYVSSK